MKAPSKSPTAIRGFAPVSLIPPWLPFGQTDATGKPSVVAPPAREFTPTQRNPLRGRTREQGGLRYLPSSHFGKNWGHEVARIGGRCASDRGEGLIATLGGNAGQKKGVNL